jgi:hypothetical protein
MIGRPENAMRRDFPLCEALPILTGPVDGLLVNRPALTDLGNLCYCWFGCCGLQPVSFALCGYKKKNPPVTVGA